ncbi:hypothetical protein R1sor_009307 [Riccia sorocarpa]|uniref:Uncharacterized protein n=1 Tax=Riccia sorocarpa TaxID=122646 RepID=A0ABD3HYU7_9MARC
MNKDIMHSLGLSEMRRSSVILRMADGRKVKPIGELRRVSTIIGEQTYDVDYIIMDLPHPAQFQVLLGVPWLVDADVHTSWRSGILTFGPKSRQSTLSMYNSNGSSESDGEGDGVFHLDTEANYWSPACDSDNELVEYLSGCFVIDLWSEDEGHDEEEDDIYVMGTYPDDMIIPRTAKFYHGGATGVGPYHGAVTTSSAPDKRASDLYQEFLAYMGGSQDRVDPNELDKDGWFESGYDLTEDSPALGKSLSTTEGEVLSEAEVHATGEEVIEIQSAKGQAEIGGVAILVNGASIFLPVEFELPTDFVILRANKRRTRVKGKITMPKGFEYKILPEHEVLYHVHAPVPGDEFSCSFLAYAPMQFQFPPGSSLLISD